MTTRHANRLSGTLGTNYQIDLYISDCATCGILFGITTEMERRRREDHGTFYCPNGHSMSFSQETDAEKYKRLYHSAEERAGQFYDRAETAERSRRALKGVVTRTRNRIVAGSCPFGCRRHFANLERHVASKHPGAVLESEAS